MAPSLLGRALLTWVGNCVALWVAAAIVPAIDFGDKFGTLVLAGAILGIVNFALRPLIVLFTLPFVIITLGFGLLLINMLMLWVTSKLVTGLQIGDFWSTLWGAIIIWLINMAPSPLIGRRAWRRAMRAGE